jgi:uncharacterized protein YjeT (DUF2065 family)
MHQMKKGDPEGYLYTAEVNVSNLDVQPPRQPTLDALGGHFERARVIHDALSTKEQTKKWVMLSITLFFSLLLVNGMVYATLDFFLASDSSQSLEDSKKNTTPAADSQKHSSVLAMSYTHPISSMNNSEFQVYLVFFLWITIIFSGLGLEFIALMFLPAKWTSKLQFYWTLAQCLFSLFVAASVGMAVARNYAALPIFVAGMWKFGFPQTITFMFNALNDTSLTRLQSIGYFMNAIGLLLHHTAGGLAISMAVTGVIKNNTADVRTVLDVILIPMMQHWFFFLRYVHKNTYIVVELSLEVWYEWITLSNLEGLFANHWTAALFGGTFLVAHWFFLGAAAIEIFVEKIRMKENKKVDEPVLLARHGLCAEGNLMETA